MTENKQDTIHTTRPDDTLNYSEWLSAVKQQQREYHAKQTEEMKHDHMSDYELFIEYIIFDANIVGYSEISIIARIVRYFVGSISGVSIFNETLFRFNGIRISIAIHPITSHIYIADESSIYKFEETDQKLKTIAKLSTTKNMKITDLTFSSTGKELLCLMNSNLHSVCYVKISDENICIENRILYYTSYDNMDYLRYDFNHFYFDPSYLINLLNFCDILYNNNNNPSMHINMRAHSTLYTLDIYKKELWIICNSITTDSNNEHELHTFNQPILIKIPFKFVEITRQLQLLNSKMKTISHEAMDDIENDEYEQKLQHLQNEINELRLERNKNENKCEVIDLYILLKLKEIHMNANITARNPIQATISIVAFDVDKLHNGIFVITSDKNFFRIEKQKRDDIKYCMNDNGCWFSKANKIYPNHFIHTTYKWNITHQDLLHNILPDGLPLGVCNARYDSITGRIIVADNYKIQGLYI